jgi:hypothetical protein
MARLSGKGHREEPEPDYQSPDYIRLCTRYGLDHSTKPFEFLRLNGQLVLYPTRVAAEQLRVNHGLTLTVTARETLTAEVPDPYAEGKLIEVDDIYVVRVHVKDRLGREDEATGAVSVNGLTGEALAAAHMKAETKAKRRATLSICGIGLPDESEVETPESDNA